MPGPTATVEYGSDGVAVISLQNPPVNALHPAGAHKRTGARAATQTPVQKHLALAHFFRCQPKTHTLLCALGPVCKAILSQEAGFMWQLRLSA